MHGSLLHRKAMDKSGLASSTYSTRTTTNTQIKSQSILGLFSDSIKSINFEASLAWEHYPVSCRDTKSGCRPVNWHQIRRLKSMSLHTDTDKAIESLISTFNELNSNLIDELHEEPSPLEFMRYVARNTPFVIRGGASSWKACQQWNSAYLLSALKGQSVNVAVTPHGYVDAWYHLVPNPT